MMYPTAGRATTRMAWRNMPVLTLEDFLAERPGLQAAGIEAEDPCTAVSLPVRRTKT